MRLLVTGREGQVARALAERGGVAGHDVVLVGRPELDLSGDASAIEKAIAARRPDIIVSAAAYTAVDKAESEPGLAFAVNATGAGSVARAARYLNIPLVHLSTDYVFGGEKPVPYVEGDPVGPRTVYGATKLEGERQVMISQANSVILRTAWVFSPFGNNFVRTMLRLAEKRDEIAVVQDQQGNPTSALDIADGVLAIAANLLGNPDLKLRGIFHMTSTSGTNWAEFARTLFALSSVRGGASAAVRPIPTSEYQTLAPRPLNSRLDCTLLEARHGVRLRDWQGALDTVIARLVTPSQETESMKHR
jgi:dTDP-4-dehydrorhamnose reductase